MTASRNAGTVPRPGKTRDSATEATRPDRWGAAWAAMLGVFVLVVAEQLPIGLLPSMSTSLRVTEGVAGVSVTVPSVVAAIAAPAVPLLVGRLDRRALLVVLMAIMTVANAATWLAPTFEVLLVSRVFVGVAIGGFWAIGGGLAVRLVSAANVPRATSIIFSGVAAASVLGVPLGAALGEATDWRVAFASLGALALVSLAILIALLPRLDPATAIRPRLLLGQFGNRAVVVGLVATLLAVTGHFAAFTFVGPILRDLAGLPVAAIGPILLGYGIAGLIGNLVAGSWLGRSVPTVVITILAVMAVVLAVLPVVGLQPVTGVGLLLLWGLFFGGLSVSLQTWMIKAAPAAVEAATALWVAVWNLAIGIGALAGGIAVDRVSLPAAIWIAGGVVLGSAVIVVAGRAVRRAPVGTVSR